MNCYWRLSRSYNGLPPTLPLLIRSVLSSSPPRVCAVAGLKRWWDMRVGVGVRVRIGVFVGVGVMAMVVIGLNRLRGITLIILIILIMLIMLIDC